MIRAILLLQLVILTAPAGATGTVERLLAEYRATGAGPFDVDRGQRLWVTESTHKNGERRACTNCHNADLRQAGRHATTGKRIEPLAPSVRANRLTDEREIRKWLLRNCKWTFGRECTARENGDFLTFIQSQ